MSTHCIGSNMDLQREWLLSSSSLASCQLASLLLWSAHGQTNSKSENISVFKNQNTDQRTTQQRSEEIMPRLLHHVHNFVHLHHDPIHSHSLFWAVAGGILNIHTLFFLRIMAYFIRQLTFSPLVRPLHYHGSGNAH